MALVPVFAGSLLLASCAALDVARGPGSGWRADWEAAQSLQAAARTADTTGAGTKYDQALAAAKSAQAKLESRWFPSQEETETIHFVKKYIRDLEKSATRANTNAATDLRVSETRAKEKAQDDAMAVLLDDNKKAACIAAARKLYTDEELLEATGHSLWRRTGPEGFWKVTWKCDFERSVLGHRPKTYAAGVVTWYRPDGEVISPVTGGTYTFYVDPKTLAVEKGRVVLKRIADGHLPAR